MQCVFTARYELDLQIRYIFVLQGLKGSSRSNERLVKQTQYVLPFRTFLAL